MYKKILPGLIFYLSKTGPCAVFSSQNLSKFPGKVGYYLFCMPLLVFFVSIVQDLGLK